LIALKNVGGGQNGFVSFCSKMRKGDECV
jgi:hypothetical protein